MSTSRKRAYSNDNSSEKIYFSSYSYVSIRSWTLHTGQRRMQLAGQLRAITNPARLNETTNWLSFALIDESGIRLLYHSTTVLSYLFVCNFLGPLLEGTRFTIWTDQNSIWWILNLADTIRKLTRWRLGLFQFEIDIVHRAGIKQDAVDALSRVPIDETVNTSLENKLPVLETATGENTIDTNTTIFALEPHTSPPTHFVIDADGTNVTSPTLAKFSTAQSADEFVSTPPDSLSRLGHYSRVTKKKCLWDAPLSMELYKRSCRSQCSNTCWTCDIILLLPVTLANFLCMTLCEGIINGRIMLEMCTELWTAATVVPKAVPHLSTNATCNFSLQRDRWNLSQWISSIRYPKWKRTTSSSTILRTNNQD